MNLKRLNRCVVASRFRYEKPGHTAGDQNQETGVASWTCKTVSCTCRCTQSVGHTLGSSGTVAITIIASLHSDYQPDRGQVMKTMREVMRHIRLSLGARVTSYVDDWLLIKAYLLECASLTEQVTALFRQLQLQINNDKSSLHSAQFVVYLGIRWDTSSRQVLVRVPSDKLLTIRRTTTRLLRDSHERSVPTRVVAQVAGRIAAVTKAVPPARLMLRALYRHLAKARNVNRAVTLSRQSLTDLEHFLERIQTWNGRYLTTPSPSVTMTTNASDYGRGMT